MSNWSAKKKKAVTFSYDDGTTQDIRLIELLNRYNLKATFNLNSGLLGKNGWLIRENEKISHYKVWPGDVRELYMGHEVAVHTLTHIRQAQKQAEKTLAALQNRRQQLELILQNLYEQLIDGSTDRAAYLTQKQKITAQLQELTEKEAELKAAASASEPDTSPLLERYRQYTELDTLTPAIAKELVQRVVVYPDSRLEVQLNCRDELANINEHVL